MILNLNYSFESKKQFIELKQIVSKDPEAFRQILLSLCKDKTFNRIRLCPRYPVRVLTADLEQRLNLFFECISENHYIIPALLASLFNSSTSSNSKKLNGQYFTPQSVAEEAVKFLSLKNHDIVFDPGCGTGIFPISILKYLYAVGSNPNLISYVGIENDPYLALAAAVSLDIVQAPNNWQIVNSDFLSQTVEDYLARENIYPTAVISNPPFVRTHRLTGKKNLKDNLRISGHSGLHSFFLAKSEKFLKNGRMVFVLPLEMDKAKYGKALLNSLGNTFIIEKKNIVFANELYSIEDCSTEKLQSKTSVAKLISFHYSSDSRLNVDSSKQDCLRHVRASLGDIATVHRGISTGANDFFVLSEYRAKELMIPNTFLTKIIPPVIPRSRLNEVFTSDDWEKFRAEGMPCWLFSVKSEMSIEELPVEVRQYIKTGERNGFKTKYTCAKRTNGCWYSVKLPNIPQIFVTNLYREYPKLIYNQAHVLNLTNFLGIHIRSLTKPIELTNRLNIEVQQWINHSSEGRKYAGGWINIGPGDISKMPVSENILNIIGITGLLKK